MCWPEADLDPVQGVSGLEKAQLAGLVSAAPSGPQSVGHWCVYPEKWVPKGLWLGTDLARSPVQHPEWHAASSRLSKGANSADIR